MSPTNIATRADGPLATRHFAEIREVPDWCGPSTWSAELDGALVGDGYRSTEEAQAAVTAAMRERHDMIPAHEASA